MTAEIAILNRYAIALAADSAVTVGDKRVYKTSTKLFSLGPGNDIAVMIYGSDQFCGFPWDAIIKTFHRSLGKTEFGHVSDFADALIEYLKCDEFKPNEEAEILNLSYVVDHLEKLAEKTSSSSNRTQFLAAIDNALTEAEAQLEKADVINGICSERDFCAVYDHIISSFSADIFGRKLSKKRCKRLTRYVHGVLSRKARSPYSTGVVVAGFGKKEYFPAVVHLIVDGKGDFGFRQWTAGNGHDANQPDEAQAAIIPFAQSDIFRMFMEGISPDQITFIRETLSHVLNAKSDELVKAHVPNGKIATVERAKQARENKAALTKFMEEFALYREKNVVDRILEVVSHLPKEDLADMAIALVELTSLRRKIDSTLETVGGPVDVAVISKGDGLVWIKRKTYFDPSLNKEFLFRKFGGNFGDIS